MFNFIKARRLRKEGRELIGKKFNINYLNLQKSNIDDKSHLKCPNCQEVISFEIIQRLLYTCSSCSFLFRLTAQQRIEITFDSFKEFFYELPSVNPLGMDIYQKKLDQLKKTTNKTSAVTIGIAKIKDLTIAAFVMDSHFIMGSLGLIEGEKIVQVFQHAKKHNLAVVGFCTSGGARMQEGMYALMQMVRTSAAVGQFFKSKNSQPYISVLTSPTYGGVSASFAMLGDIIMAEEQAMIGFAGKNVIKNANSSIKLASDFQTASYLQKNGFVDLVLARQNIKDNLYKILTWHKPFKIKRRKKWAK